MDKIWYVCCDICIGSLLQKLHFPIEVVPNSLQTQEGLELGFQVPVFAKFSDNFFSFLIWHKLARFHSQTMYFPSYSVKRISCFCWGIWCCHEIWISKILKFDFLENKKSFWSEIKSISPNFTNALF